MLSLSPREFADITGYSYQTVCRWLKNNNCPKRFLELYFDSEGGILNPDEKPELATYWASKTTVHWKSKQMGALPNLCFKNNLPHDTTTTEQNVLKD